MSLTGGSRGGGGGGRHPHPLTGGARGAPAPVLAVPNVAAPGLARPGAEIEAVAAPQAPPPSVLVMSHSHPRLTHGGAEISAYALYRGLKARGASAWFLGCGTHDAPVRLGAPLSQPFGPDDYLYSSFAPFDYFKFANSDPHFPGALTELIQTLRPDIVHAHHYARFGVEMFAVIKRASPGTRIVLSLHEYLAICHHLGQMVKAGSQRLCDSASPGACARCFADIPAADFFLRQRYIERFFAEVDLFLAPSQFLADRYEAWGIAPARIRVLENMPPERAAADSVLTVPLETLPMRTAMAPGAAGPASARQRAALTGNSRATKDLRVTNALVSLKRNRPLRFGFFGQMSPLKGIGVLIEAVRRLETMQVGHYSLVIYGDYSNQPDEFQNFVTAALADAPHAISFMGPYRNGDVARLMQRVDAVLVPSIWWENSPVVIQEAFASQRPVICSNIGGMAEKVRHGIDGLHFEVGRPDSLARVLANLIEHPEILAELTASVARPLDQAAALGAHIELYRGLLAV